MTVMLKQDEMPTPRKTAITGETHFDFDGHTIDIIKLDFSDTRTVLAFQLVTKTAIPEDEFDGYTNAYGLMSRSYALVDDQGNEIPGQFDMNGSARYNQQQQPDGTWIVDYQLTWDAVVDVPEYATLMPVAYPFIDGAYGNLDQYTTAQLNDIYREHFIKDEAMNVAVNHVD